MNMIIKQINKFNMLYETIILKKIETLLYSHPYMICALFLIIAPIFMVVSVSICTCIIVFPIAILFGFF